MIRWRVFVLVVALISGILQMDAQGRDEVGLVGLIQRLPSLTAAERADMGPYSDAFDAAYKKNPASLESTATALSSDLEMQDPWVQRMTVVLISSLALESNNTRFILHFSDQLSRILISGDEYTRRAAINAASILGKAAPQSIVDSLLATLKDRNSSDDLLSGSLEALLLTRQSDVRVGQELLSAVSDPTRTSDQRCFLLAHTGAAESLVGQPIVDYVVAIANTSDDICLRDAAIHAAERIGPRALNPISAKLHVIETDPKESSDSRSGATRALKRQAHSVLKPTIPSPD